MRGFWVYFLKKATGFAEGLDVGCELKRDIKDSKIFSLQYLKDKVDTNHDGKMVGNEGLSVYNQEFSFAMERLKFLLGIKDLWIYGPVNRVYLRGLLDR